MSSDPVRLPPERDERTPRVERIEARLADRSVLARRQLRWILPLLVLALAGGVYWALIATKATPDRREPVVPTPLVRVVTARPEPFRLRVESQGIALPRTESNLVAEVRGRILEVAPQLVEGGFFEAGDVLLRLDDREHRITLDRARASVALRVSEERLAVADARRRRELASRGAASPAELEQFESRELVAQAALQESRAALAQAELDLERTVLRAPFDGRVRERGVDVGQFVAPGEKLARLFAVDYAEVRLPVQIDQLGFLDFELDFAQPQDQLVGTEVTLRAPLGGSERTWPARIVRTEAAIDERTRMLYLVARVEDPYRLRSGASSDGEEAGRGEAVPVPLPSGLFVEAEIAGRALEDVFVLPIMALRDGERVFVLGEDGRLQIRDVAVLRRDRDRVVLESGLESGEQVVISPLRIYSEGMALRRVEAEES